MKCSFQETNQTQKAVKPRITATAENRERERQREIEIEIELESNPEKNNYKEQQPHNIKSEHQQQQQQKLKPSDDIKYQGGIKKEIHTWCSLQSALFPGCKGHFWDNTRN